MTQTYMGGLLMTEEEEGPELRVVTNEVSSLQSDPDFLEVAVSNGKDPQVVGC